MRKFFNEKLSVTWFTFALLNLFFWSGILVTISPFKVFGWFALLYVIWAGLWIWFADKPKKI
jgi:hypothetical protein